jgi:hypothetical protein
MSCFNISRLQKPFGLHVPSIDVVSIDAQKGVLQAVSAKHVARRTQVVLKAYSTLPEYSCYLTVVTAMAASVDMLHT